MTRKRLMCSKNVNPLRRGRANTQPIAEKRVNRLDKLNIQKPPLLAELSVLKNAWGPYRKSPPHEPESGLSDDFLDTLQTDCETHFTCQYNKTMA